MADNEHLEKLQRGCETWNKWVSEFRGRPDLSELDLSEKDLRGFSFKNTEFKNTNLKRSKLCKARFLDANLTGASLVGASLKGGTINNCTLHGADFRGITIDEATIISSPHADKNCKIDEYFIKSLEKNNQFNSRLRAQFDIYDDLASIRQSYSGLNFWLGLLSLFGFTLPYLWFVALHYAEAIVFIDPEKPQMTLGVALLRFIVTGGENWQNSWSPSFSVFLFGGLCMYHAVRFGMLAKTNALEHEQAVNDAPVQFSLETDPRTKYWHELMPKLKKVAAAFLIANILSFMFLKIPVYS